MVRREVRIGVCGLMARTGRSRGFARELVMSGARILLYVLLMDSSPGDGLPGR